MRILHYLARSANPLNILLAAIMLAAAVFIILPLTKMNTRYTLPQPKPKTVEEAEIPLEKTAAVLASDYTVIGEQNLFHPERRIPVDKKVEEVPRPELILYGTMIQDNIQYAFIENKKSPQTSPGRGTRQTTVKKGDSISGFVISEIGADRITLTRGDDKMTVLLSSADKRKNGAGTQGPAQMATPARPAQTSPSNPFGPGPGTQQIGGRPPGTTPATQSPAAVPQPLPRPVGRGMGRTPAETTPMP